MAERWKTMAHDHDMYEGVQRRTLEACCSDSDAVRMEFAKNLRDDVEVCLRDAASTTVALALHEAREAGVEVDGGMMEAAKDATVAAYGEARRGLSRPRPSSRRSSAAASCAAATTRRSRPWRTARRPWRSTA